MQFYLEYKPYKCLYIALKRLMKALVFLCYIIA